MKTLKTLVILLACAGSIGAMDCASSSAAESGARAPLVDHDVCVTTVGGEVCFTPEQLMKLGTLRDMLEEEVPTERGKNINLTAICAESPCLRYEGLHHIPALVDCETRADVDRYLEKINPEEACSAVLALHFLRAPQNIFAWAHAYVVRRLVNDGPFAIRCLASSEMRQNINLLMTFCRTESIVESIRLLGTMFLKNHIAVARQFDFDDDQFRANQFLLAPDGLSLAIERSFDDDCAIMLYHAGCRRCLAVKHAVAGCDFGGECYSREKFCFSPDGSLVAVHCNVGSDCFVRVYATGDGQSVRNFIRPKRFSFSPNSLLCAIGKDTLHGHGSIVLVRISDGSQIISPVRGRSFHFSPSGLFLATWLETDQHDVSLMELYRTSDGSKVNDLISGRKFSFSPNDLSFAVVRGRDGDDEVASIDDFDDTVHDSVPASCFVDLYRTDGGGQLVKSISGKRFVFSPDSSLLAIDQEINDYHYVGLYRTEDGSQVGSLMPGWLFKGPMVVGVFNFDSTLLAISQTNGDMYCDGLTILHSTKDASPVGAPILGEDPCFSPDGSLMLIAQSGGDEKALVLLYRLEDYNHESVLGSDPCFSRDGLLFKIENTEDECGESVYFVDDVKPFLKKVNHVQFGRNGTIACRCGKKIIFIQPVALTSAEYSFVLAAIHQGRDIDEAIWRDTFDRAPEQLKIFVRKKTGGFLLTRI